MFTYSRTIIALLLFMILARGGLGAFSYIAPEAAFSAFQLNHDPSSPIVYFVRLWAGRDVVLAILVLVTAKEHLKTLIKAYICIELLDILGAYLGMQAGFFSLDDFLVQVVTVLAALIPESIALYLIKRADQSTASRM
jgi:hypothetical protein